MKNNKAEEILKSLEEGLKNLKQYIQTRDQYIHDFNAKKPKEIKIDGESDWKSNVFSQINACSELLESLKKL
jgi:hypothetical protein